MKIIGTCERCKEKKLFIRKRVYTHHMAGVITSQDELCGKCYNLIKKMLDSEPKGNDKN